MRLADQAAIMTLGRFAERGIGVLSGIVLVRLLTKDDYATYLQVGLVGQLCLTFLLFGLPQSFLYFVPRADPRDRKAVILGVLGVVAGVAALGGLALALGSPLIVRAFHNPGLAALGPLIGLYAFLLALDRTIEPSFIALTHARRAAILAGLSAVLMVGATLVPAWRGWGVAAIYMGITLVLLVRLTTFGTLLAREPGRPRRDGGGLVPLGALLAFAVPMGLSALTLEYNRLLDGVIVSLFFAPAQYATYARGAFELPVIDLLVFTLVNVTLPRLVAIWKTSDRAVFLGVWNRLVRMQALAVFPTFAYASFFAQEIIVTLFSAVYRDSTPVFRVYLFTLPLRVTSCAILFQAVGDTKGLLHSTVRSLAFNLACTPLLCLLLGPIGAAWGYLGSQAFLIAYILRRLHTRTGFPVADLLPWGWLARMTGVVVAAGLVVLPLGRLVEAPLLRLLVTGPVFLALCGAAFFRFGLLGAEETGVVRRWLGREVAGAGARGGD